MFLGGPMAHRSSTVLSAHCLIIALFLALPIAAQAATPQTVTTDKHTINLKTDQRSTEISIVRQSAATDGAGFADPKVSWLTEPTRLIIDIPGEAVGRSFTQTFDSGELSALRLGGHPDKARFVFEFRNGGKRNVSMVRAANRGVVSFVMPVTLSAASALPSKPTKIAAASVNPEPAIQSATSSQTELPQTPNKPAPKVEVITAPRSPVAPKVQVSQLVAVESVAIADPEIAVAPPPAALAKPASQNITRSIPPASPAVIASAKLVPITGDPFPIVPVLLGIAAFFLTLGYGMRRVAIYLEKPARPAFAPELDGTVHVLTPVTTGIAARIEREFTEKSAPIELEEKDEWPADTVSQ